MRKGESKRLSFFCFYRFPGISLFGTNIEIMLNSKVTFTKNTCEMVFFLSLE